MTDKFFTFDKPISEAELITTAKSAIAKRLPNTPILSSAKLVRDYLTLELANKPMEVFYVLFLSNQHQLLGMEAMFHGTIDGASVYPREIVRKVLEYNAAAVILAHNHPSGKAEPSRADQTITARIQEALGFIDVRVVDHLVIGSEEVVSFAQRGLL